VVDAMFVRFRTVHLGVGRYPLEGKPVTHLLLYEVSAVREALLAQTHPRRAGDPETAQGMTFRTQPVSTPPNNARLDNRRGSLLSPMIFSDSNINPALYAPCRPSGASA
jgi:hypothetical protein